MYNFLSFPYAHRCDDRTAFDLSYPLGRNDAREIFVVKKTLFDLYNGGVDVEQRFREIEIWVRLSHKNIIPLHDIQVSMHENSLSIYTVHVGSSVIPSDTLRR